MVNFRLTARWDAKEAKAFPNKAIERIRLHRPVKICTGKAPAYRRVIHEINNRYDPHFDSLHHIDCKERNNPIESDQASGRRSSLSANCSTLTGDDSLAQTTASSKAS